MNDEQIAYWSGNAGERWVAQQAEMDRVIRPLGQAAMDAAKIVVGEAIIDVGCGCGDTTLALAARVGEKGRVLGVDVSVPMLARAHERVKQKPATSAPVELREADASVAELPSSDLLFSRFGVMFFADPMKAFSHLHASSKRLAFVCWRRPADNAWASLTLAAVAPFGDATRLDPHAPGPFAFADRERVRAMLTTAGYRDVSIEPFDQPLQWTTTASTADSLAFMSTIGPAASRLGEMDPATRARATSALGDALRPYVTERGLVLDAGVWIVTATA